MAIAVRSRRHDRQTQQTRRKERSSKNKGKLFGKRVDIPEEPIRIHFHRPEEPYQDPFNPEDHYWWKKGAKHYIPKLNKFTECALDQCLTCAYRDPTDFGFPADVAQRFLEKAWPKEYYSFNVLVDEYYVFLDRERRSPGPNGETTWKERVLEKQAVRELKESGQDPRKMDLMRVYGFRGFLDLSGPAFANEFGAVYEQIERYTRDGGYLIPMYYGCSECATRFFSVGEECPTCGSDDCGLSQDDNGNITHKMFCNSCESEWELLESESKPLRKEAEALYQCENCSHKGYPMPFFVKVDLESGDMEEEEPEGGWDRYDIFDVQMTVRKQRQSDDAPPRIVIDSWRFADLDPRHFDPEYQGGKNDETAQKVAEANKKPYDLNVVHSPDEPSAQAKILNLDNLFARQAAASRQQKSRAIRYGKRTEENGEDAESGDESED